jgi:hypothetical protein
MDHTVFSLGMFSTELAGAFLTTQHEILRYSFMHVKVSQNSVLRLFLGIIFSLKRSKP